MPKSCPVCNQVDCHHVNPVIVRLSNELRRRLEPAPLADNIYSRWHVQAQRYGKLPVAIYFSPKHPKLGGVFWVKDTRTGGGNLHQSILHMVQVDDTPEVKNLALHESADAFTTDQTVIAAGRSENGFFALSTAAVAPATTQRHKVGVWNLEVQSLNTLGGWMPGEFAGVRRQTIIQDATYQRRGPTLAIYDHREAYTDDAYTVVTEKSSANRRWFHVDLYPTTGTVEGRVSVGRGFGGLIAGEYAGWIWQSTSTGAGQMQASMVVMVVLSEHITIDHEASVAAATAGDNPAALCDALEDLVMAHFALREPSQQDESIWGRYNALRARAERTEFVNEVRIAWRKAIFTLARLAGYPFGYFDDWVAQHLPEEVQDVE